MLFQWIQYDCHAHHDCYSNTYSFVKDGVKIKLTPLPPSGLDKNKNESKSLVSLITKTQFKEVVDEVQTMSFILMCWNKMRLTNITLRVGEIVRTNIV